VLEKKRRAPAEFCVVEDHTSPTLVGRREMVISLQQDLVSRSVILWPLEKDAHHSRG
jgi:hypothetical protein